MTSAIPSEPATPRRRRRRRRRRPRARSPVTIQWLPPELIKRILELAVHALGICNPCRSPDTDPTAQPSPSRYSILRSANTVCRAWEYEAQALLWKTCLFGVTKERNAYFLVLC